MPYHTRPARPKPTGWAYLLDYQIHNGGSTPTLDVQPGDTLWCRAHEGLHVRSGPHTHANIAGLLRIGENVKCLQCQEWNPRRVQWARIRTHDGIEGWADAGWLMADYVRPAIGVKGLIAPPSLYAALCQSQRLLASWKRSTVMPRLLLAIAALESDVRTRAEYGGMLVSRFEEGVFDRLRKTISNGEARRQSTSWGVMQVMGFHFNAPFYAGQFRECRDWIEWLGSDTAHEWLAGANCLIDRWGMTAAEPTESDFVAIAKAYNGAGERRLALAQHRTPYDQLLAERYAQASVMTYDAYTQEDRDMADKTPPAAPAAPPGSPQSMRPIQSPDPAPHRSVTGRAVQAAGSPALLVLHTVLHVITLLALTWLGWRADGRSDALDSKTDQVLTDVASVAAAVGDQADADDIQQALDVHAQALGAKLDLQGSTMAALAAPPTPLPYVTVLPEQGLNFHSAPQITDSNREGTWPMDTHLANVCQVQGTVDAFDTGNPIVVPVARTQANGQTVYAVFRAGSVDTLSYGPQMVPACAS